MNFLGIDIGGSSVKAAALRNGKAVWTGQSSRYSNPSAAKLAAAIREAVAARTDAVRAVGLCVPGLLDQRREKVTLAVNVPGLQGLPLVELASGVVGRKLDRVAVSNDSNAAAVDIYESRGLSGRLLALVLGTGVGASVIDDGRIIRVDGDSPGHVGSIDVSLDATAPIGPDGGRGSLEAYLGAPALGKRYGADVAAAMAGMRLTDPAMRALVRTIRICHAIFRPRHVCLAGGIGIRLGRLIAELQTEVNRELTSVARSDWALSVGDSDYHAAIGAARLAARDEKRAKSP